LALFGKTTRREDLIDRRVGGVVAAREGIEPDLALQSHGETPFQREPELKKGPQVEPRAPKFQKERSANP